MFTTYPYPSIESGHAHEVLLVTGPMANVTKRLRSNIRPPHEATFQWNASLDS